MSKSSKQSPKRLWKQIYIYISIHVFLNLAQKNIFAAVIVLIFMSFPN